MPRLAAARKFPIPRITFFFRKERMCILPWRLVPPSELNSEIEPQLIVVQHRARVGARAALNLRARKQPRPLQVETKQARQAEFDAKTRPAGMHAVVLAR